jgi:hydroxymethylglutaryl-CoA reductase (NADPH)
MTTNAHKLQNMADQVLKDRTADEVRKALAPDHISEYKRFPSGSECSPGELAKRWAAISGITDPQAIYAGEDLQPYAANIENCIGTVKIPVGIAGPLRVNGTFAKGDYLLPLATSEAALIASYHRGAVVISKSGGCSAFLMSEGVTRSPGFAFRSISELISFSHWILLQKEFLFEVAAGTSQHGRLQDVRFAAEGNHLYLLCDFSTADAAGQNMVTIATQAICDYIVQNTPVQPEYWFVEANASGDKKASSQSFTTVRGKKVSVEVVIPEKIIKKFLHTSTERIVDYWRMSALGGVMTGTIGVQGHYANGLAALFIACGQDAACVSEAAVGITRLEKRPDNSLYASATLPNLIVGTVGGGTKLPSQKSCLEIMQLAGNGNGKAFAEVCAGAALAGEISIIGSLAAGDFTKAHHGLARER